MTLPWIISGVVLLITIAAGTEAYLKRNRKRRPLAETQPQVRKWKSRLGQETTDLDLVAETHRENQLIENNKICPPDNEKRDGHLTSHRPTRGNAT